MPTAQGYLGHQEKQRPDYNTCIYIEREATRRLGEPQFQATGAFSKMGTDLLVSGYLRMGGVSGHR